MQHALVMPMHDPDGLLFPHLVRTALQLRERFARAVISIAPPTRAHQGPWVERVMADAFFTVCEFTQSQPVGDEFVQLYVHAAATCPPETLLHLCFIDRWRMPYKAPTVPSSLPIYSAYSRLMSR